MKICNKFIYTINQLYLPIMPIKIPKLHHIKKYQIISNFFRFLYQHKVGSLLFGAIATKPNIAFPVFHLSGFNQQLRLYYHEVTNQIFYYLFLMQNYYICYEGKA